MRVGISGTHGTGKTTLAGALCAHLPGHVMADEPYYLLEEEGHEFGFPPSLEDYRALLARSLRSLSSPLLPGVVFDRTPLDYLAYLVRPPGGDRPSIGYAVGCCAGQQIGRYGAE
jgi:AAA domain